LTAGALCRYVTRQINNFFPDCLVKSERVAPYLGLALERTEHCFSRVSVKYFARNGTPWFDHLHSDQYAMFLYLLSNSVFREDGDPSLAAKIYALNKALHGLDVFYEVELPAVFFFQHPVGTVLGRAAYGNYFAVYQRCSIGSSLSGETPVMGDGVAMFGGSAIIGGSRIGSNAWLSVNAVVMDCDVPPDSLVFGRSPANVLKPATCQVVERFFEAS
jgi:serine O-acetyltransferase